MNPTPPPPSSQAWHTLPGQGSSSLTQSLTFVSLALPEKRKMVLLDSALRLLGAWRSRCGLRASAVLGAASQPSRMNRVWRQCSCVFLILSVSSSCTEYGSCWEAVGGSDPEGPSEGFPQGVYSGSPGAGFPPQNHQSSLWGWS